MKRKIQKIIGGVLLLALLLGAMQVRVEAQTPQVRLVFFTSPACGFCAQVKAQDLPPLENQYGEQLKILEIDTSTEAGQQLFQETLELYNVPAERRGVPMMVVGKRVLVGAGEIPAQLPGLVAHHLEAGGLDWPALPGLEEMTVAETDSAEAGGLAVWGTRFRQDLPGNYVSLTLLMGMLALAAVLARARPWQRTLSRRVSFWLKVGITLVGLGVALYLTYGETTPEELVCGPIGQCNVVQQSELAMLFGFLPMALFGALGYLAILATYAYERWGQEPYVELALVMRLALTTFGFGFSLFLTFWQPFGIGATCMWCLASAVTMSLSFLFNVGAGRAVLERIHRQGWPAYLRHLKRRARRRRRKRRTWSSRSAAQQGGDHR